MKASKRKPCNVDLSPTSFGVRQTELAKNADLVYNNMIGPSAKRVHQSIAEAQIAIDVPDDIDNHIIIDELEPDTIDNQGAKDDLIILQPKKLLELPIEENEKFPVSDEDCLHYNSIIEVAYTKSAQKYVVQFYGMLLSIFYTFVFFKKFSTCPIYHSLYSNPRHFYVFMWQQTGGMH